jgi:hypothetical protein
VTSAVTTAPLPEIVSPPEPKKFYVTAEELLPRINQWIKVFDLDQPTYVVTDLTTEETIKSFVKKLQEQEEKVKKVPMIQRDSTWRVFLANNLPTYYEWLDNWDKRKDYLLDMTNGNRTIGEIGITPENNRILFFINLSLRVEMNPNTIIGKYVHQ